MCEVLNGISIRIRRIHTKIQAELVSYKIRSLNRITAFVFVICAPLYLRIVCVRSAVSIYPSLYCVVPDLFVSLSMPFVVIVLFSVRPYLYFRLFIVSYRFFSSLFLSMLFRSCSSSSSLSSYSYRYGCSFVGSWN